MHVVGRRLLDGSILSAVEKILIRCTTTTEKRWKNPVFLFFRTSIYTVYQPTSQHHKEVFQFSYLAILLYELLYITDISSSTDLLFAWGKSPGSPSTAIWGSLDGQTRDLNRYFNIHSKFGVYMIWWKTFSWPEKCPIRNTSQFVIEYPNQRSLNTYTDTVACDVGIAESMKVLCAKDLTSSAGLFDST